MQTSPFRTLPFRTLRQSIVRTAAGVAAAALILGANALTAAPAAARTSVSIGVGVGGPGYFGNYYAGYRPHWRHPYWGPRPYWYSAGWYRPYSYWGPGFNFYASWPVAYVDTWPEPVRVYHRDAYSAALAGPIGQSYGWDDGRDSGAVTAVRDGHSGEKYCREFRQDVSINGRHEEAYGAACREADGSWRIVPDNP